MAKAVVDRIVKRYGEKLAVDDLSFSVEEGELFGLIGPNGAGKTSTIRMMMDIIKPDSGRISIFGEQVSERTKSRLGYLPEERGLYRKLTVLETIVYLATLKGLDERSARDRALALLERTHMSQHAAKKVDELSKGMSQIIQFIVTIVHDPELIILDEPFTGLDPINTELLKGLLVDLRHQGRSVILSLHQMNQVEELCDRILMINEGRAVLYGELQEIKARYRSNSVILAFEGELGAVAGVAARTQHKGCVELTLESATTPDELLKRLVGMPIRINRFEVATPSLNEIFLVQVGGSHE